MRLQSKVKCNLLSLNVKCVSVNVCFLFVLSLVPWPHHSQCTNYPNAFELRKEKWNFNLEKLTWHEINYTIFYFAINFITPITFQKANRTRRKKILMWKFGNQIAQCCLKCLAIMIIFHYRNYLVVSSNALPILLPSYS